MPAGTGTQFVVFDTSGSGRIPNLVYTTTTGATPLDPTTFFNIEVFTGTDPGVGAIDPGFDGSIFIENAVPGSRGDTAIAPTFAATLLAGDFGIADNPWSGRTQPASITFGTGAQDVIGFGGDTIIGGSGSSAQMAELNRGAVPPGPESVLGGSAPLIVQGSANSTITGGSGPMTVNAFLGGDQITGGTGDLVVNGNQSTSAAGNNIAGPTVASASSYVFAGIADTIMGGAGSLTIWLGGNQNFFNTALSRVVAQSDSITGGSGDITVQGGHSTPQTDIFGTIPPPRS